MQTTDETPGVRPSGLADDPITAARTLAARLGTQINLPEPGRPGLLMRPGAAEQVAAAAQVCQAIALAEIAGSLKALTAALSDDETA